MEQFRTLNSKRIQNADGSFTEQIYLEPIHYEDPATGKLLPIDSTLQLESDGRLHNKANSFDVSLPVTAHGGPVSLKTKDAVLSFEPVFTDDIQGVNKDNKQDFKNAAKDIDLSYAATFTGVKESIILKKPTSQTTFSFRMDLNTLQYKIQDDGSVAFTKGTSKKPSFTFDPPILIDAKGDTSTKAAYQFRQDSTGHTFVDLVVDPVWLQDPERSYPIIVDPSVGTDDSYLANSMIASKYPTGIDENNVRFSQYSSLLIGNSVNKGITRSLLKFRLPALPAGSVISDASLYVINSGYQMDVTQTPTVDAHRINTFWDSYNVAWNTQPAIGGIDGSYTVTNQYVPELWKIPLKSLVSDWYLGIQNNYGVELLYKNENDVVRAITGLADASASHSYLSVTYNIDGLGSQEYWSMDGQVNMGNMNMVDSITDISYPGRGVDLSLSRTYNSRAKGVGVFGYNWVSPLDMRLYALQDGIARLNGSNGTIYYFPKDATGNYVSPTGLHWKLNVTSSSANLTMVDKTVYSFIPDPARAGQYVISAISDATGNTVTFGYDPNHHISTIKDGASHTINLHYNGNGLIDQATDPAGRIWSYGYLGSLDLFKVTLPSATNGTLDTLEYAYDSWHYLVSETSANKRRTYYMYSADANDDSSRRMTGISPINMLVNGNFEVSSGGNNLPDHFYFYDGLNNGKVTSLGGHVYNNNAFGVDFPAAGYSTYLSDPFAIDATTAKYTLSGFMKATSASQTTILSLYPYDNNFQLLPETQRIAITGSTDWQQKQISFAPSALPAGTAYVRVRLAASNSGGSGSSYWDGVQLEEKLSTLETDNATRFSSGKQYTFYPPGMQTASYDGEGRKHLYKYNENQNLYYSQVDPNSLSLTTTYDWTSNKVTSYSDPKNNVYTKKYDDNTGNLLYTKNPEGKYEYFDYTSNSDLKSHTLLSGAVVKSTFDTKSNNLTSHDAYGTSTAQKHDLYGNLTSFSNSIGMADNLVVNSSFEQGTTGLKFYDGNNGTWQVTSDSTAQSGKQDLQIGFQSVSSPSYSIVTSDTSLPIDPNSAYVLSGYVKTTATTGDQRGILSLLPSNGAAQLNEIGRLELADTSGWQRLRKLILPTDFPQGTSSVRIKFGASLNSGTGTTSFDTIQLQKYSVDTAYNLLDNSSFERGASSFPDYWTPAESATNAWVTTDAYAENRSVSISNAAAITAVRAVNYQPYMPDSSYTLTAFVKTQGLSANVGRVRIGEYDASKTQIGYLDSEVLGGTTDWTMLSVQLDAKKAVPNTAFLRPILVTDAAQGTIFFDNVRLTNGTPGFTTYSYTNGIDTSNTRQYSEVDPLGNTASYEYDNLGHVTSTQDPMQNVTTKFYDPQSGRLSWETPASKDVRHDYSYDRDGNLIVMTEQDPTQTTLYNKTSISYNKLGQKTAVTDYLGRTTQYFYTPSGNLENITEPTGLYTPGAALVTNHYVTMAYDPANRKSSVTYSDNTAQYQFQYDKNSNLTKVEDTTSGVVGSAEYNSMNRLSKWYDNSTHSIGYTYNEFGSVIGRSLTANQTTYQESAKYNMMNQLMTLTDLNQKENRFLYTENTLLSTVTYGNDFTTSFEYDVNGHAVTLQNKNNLHVLQSSFAYTYDKNGRVSTKTTNVGKTTYTYTANGQLLTEKSPSGETTTYSYQIDAVNNPYGQLSKKQITKTDGTVQTTTYLYDKGNQLVKVNSQDYTYDNAGNLLSNGLFQFKWDSGGRMIEVDSGGKPVATFKYDHENRRVQQQVYDSAHVDGVITNFLYDGFSSHVLAETNVSGVVTKSYTWGPSGLMGITTLDATGKILKSYTVMKNAHGDIEELWDNADLTKPAVKYQYDVWGKLISPTTPDTINPYRYADARYDSFDNLYYLMARYYDPTVGRFLSKDSISTVPDYEYAGYDPVNFVDPTGNKFESDEPAVQLPGPSSGGDPSGAWEYVLRIMGLTSEEIAGGSAAFYGSVGGPPLNAWKVGDPINAPTKAGNYPSWSTAKSRYWKNEAKFSPEEYLASDLTRMQKGRAPLHEEVGVPKELHHINGRTGADPHNQANIDALWPWDHAIVDPYRFYNGPLPTQP
ncbi:DNRLRE domain-containing protein [Tumebacillus permanentifrigoris]|uniref:DNRLRE domain-containing protein n=1 Tax=Tumebacillus permanentifrigoris TaxID=378543 RepID=UPI00147633B9|nr:DNRLRE domain-containing protein [Tumebacillus permanentifrigoris]